jgi:hypothetical protein
MLGAAYPGRNYPGEYYDPVTPVSAAAPSGWEPTCPVTTGTRLVMVAFALAVVAAVLVF